LPAHRFGWRVTCGGEDAFVCSLHIASLLAQWLLFFISVYQWETFEPFANRDEPRQLWKRGKLPELLGPNERPMTLTGVTQNPANERYGDVATVMPPSVGLSMSVSVCILMEGCCPRRVLAILLIPTTPEDGLPLEARSSASRSSVRSTQVCVTSSFGPTNPDVAFLRKTIKGGERSCNC
jgi:hypothetical protein